MAPGMSRGRAMWYRTAIAEQVAESTESTESFQPHFLGEEQIRRMDVTVITPVPEPEPLELSALSAHSAAPPDAQACHLARGLRPRLWSANSFCTPFRQHPNQPRELAHVRFASRDTTSLRLVPPPRCAGLDRCAISFHPALQEVLEVVQRPEWSRSAHEGEKFHGVPSILPGLARSRRAAR